MKRERKFRPVRDPVGESQHSAHSDLVETSPSNCGKLHGERNDFFFVQREKNTLDKEVSTSYQSKIHGGQELKPESML